VPKLLKVVFVVLFLALALYAASLNRTLEALRNEYFLSSEKLRQCEADQYNSIPNSSGSQPRDNQ
jgi:hypothetical protein